MKSSIQCTSFWETMSKRGEGKSVYKSAEDTFALAKGIDCILPLTDRVAEIGCGEGFVTEVLTTYAKEVVATDVDYGSAQATWERVKSRKRDQAVHVICCDRLEALRSGDLFDLIAFNPPYLPEEGDLRWAGGPTGIEMPLAFARSASTRLKRRGLMLLVISSLSNWTDALLVLKSMGYLVSIVGVKRVGLFEDLFVILCARRTVRVSNSYF